MKIKDTLHALLLGLVPVLAMHTHRTILWTESSPRINTPVEFLGIVLFLSDYLLLALSVIGIVRWIIEPERRHSLSTLMPQGVVWILLTIWLSIVVFWSRHPIPARYFVLHTILLLMYAFWLADFVQRGWERFILTVVVLGMSAHSLIAIAQFVHQGALGLSCLGEIPPSPGSPFRAYGLTDNPNSLGGYLMIGLFAALALAYLTKNRWCWLALAIIGTALLTTLSRGAIGATVLALLVFVAFRPMSSRVRLALLGGMAVVLGIGVVTRLDSFSWHSDGDMFLNRNFFRMDTALVIEDSPYWGVGGNSLMLEIARLNPDYPVQKYPIHNAYWVARAEAGIPGLILLVLACGAALLSFRQSWIWACCFLGICAIMMIEFYFWSSPHSRALVFFTLGMLWGHKRSPI
jgi:hypothetical protein